MGPKPRTPPTKLSLLFLLAISVSSSAISVSSSRAFDNQLKETNMTLYFQDFVGGPNATVAIVTGIPGKVWSFFSFGTIFVTDDKITVGPDRNSPEVGRGQGIYVTSSLDGANTHVLFSIVFTSEEYNGSTLEIQGRSIQLASVRETSVVGGTGKFRLAKGIATFETIYYDATIFYSVIRCNVTVLHA